MELTYRLPSLEASYNALDLQRIGFQANLSTGMPTTIPRHLMQYWDRNTPDQIRRLLNHNREVAEQAGIGHVFFDDAGAHKFLVEHESPEIVQAYALAVHPAMKCDLFRLCYLHAKGGFYVDADLALKRPLEGLFELRGSLVTFQWDTRNLRNLCNWLIGATQGSAAIRLAADETAKSILFHCQRDPQLALKRILEVSGPGIFTRSIALALGEGPQQAADRESVNVELVSTAHRHIMVGPQFLKSPLKYKSDGRNWTAGELGGGETQRGSRKWFDKFASAMSHLRWR
jgi:hypothetical protein